MTSTTALVCLALVSVIAIANACTDSSANCASWAKTGFCISASYTEADRIKYCQKTCNLCEGTCKDINKSCADFVTNGFCNSAYYSDEYKKSQCGASCGLCKSTEVCDAAKVIGPCGPSDPPCPFTCKSNGCCQP